MQNTTDKKQTTDAAGEYFFMQPKNEMLIGTPQEAPSVQKAFSAEADAGNDDHSGNTSACD